MDSLGQITPEKTAFILVDIQEKFLPAINNVDEVIKNANILAKASEILKVPLIVTEQYPKGLGKTTEKIRLSKSAHIIEKTHFSCFGCDDFRVRLKDLEVNSIILFGIEAHVCILKTALDALKNTLVVHVVADAISSRTGQNKKIAINRMRQSGIFITSTEMILFQLLEKGGTYEFKEISSLIK